MWLGLVLLSGNPFVTKPDYGIAPAVDFVRESAAAGERVTLVASEDMGESAAVSVFAQREPQPRWYVLRASKMMARASWMGFLYESRFSAPDEVAAYLEDSPVSFVILDHHPAIEPLTHFRLLQSALLREPWRVAFENGVTTVYARTKPAKPMGPAFRQDLQLRLWGSAE